MKFGFHPEAEKEYAEAVRYYLEISPQLAAGFVAEVEHGVKTICRRPLAWRIIDRDVRRYLIHRFPFGLYYEYEAERVIIWAVMHLSRKPGYWESRLGS
jgi:plasmid stabilization system protein ParE